MIDLMKINNCNMTKGQATALNPQVLAFIGDSVHTLITKLDLVQKSDCKSGDLHKQATSYLSAVAQAKHFDEIADKLSEEEIYIFKRGRNVKVNSVAKNASMAEYKKSTGYEALIGFLYLTGQLERIYELV